MEGCAVSDGERLLVNEHQSRSAEFIGKRRYRKHRDTVLRSFCSEQKNVLDLATCSAQELNDVLCKFYPSLRTKRELYKK